MSMGLIGLKTGCELPEFRSFQSAFREAVDAVRQVCAEPQMLRVATTRVIARMTQDLVVRYFAYEELVRNAVGQFVSVTFIAWNAESAIPVFVDRCQPIPTAGWIRGLVYFAPKTLTKCSSRLKVVAGLRAIRCIATMVHPRLERALTSRTCSVLFRLPAFGAHGINADAATRAKALVPVSRREEFGAAKDAIHRLILAQQFTGGSAKWA